ncbi:MAG: flagellar basal body rod protein FlgB [Rhodospirillaceae bacterium]|nr:flagellar basal body rod protein FlgB [Rhodospirillaceae bacterium]
MNLGNLNVFSAATVKMGWLNQRQTVLAQNIANADTPNYRAKDLKAPTFSKIMYGNVNMQMSKTAMGHMVGAGAKIDARVIKERNKDVYEVSPNENAVVMEEQLMKVSESSMNYKLASSIYSKNLLMFKMALNGSGR